MNSIETVKQFYDLLGQSNMEQALTLLDKDFILSQANSLPYGGEFRGRTGIKDFFGRFFRYWQTFQSKDVAYYTDQSIVFAVSTATGRSHEGKVVEMPMVQIYEVSDGKIKSAKPFYFDTAELLGQQKE